MLAAYGYTTKKELKNSVGQKLTYTETSALGPEFRPPGRFTLVGPSAYERKWYANVTVDERGIIQRVE